MVETSVQAFKFGIIEQMYRKRKNSQMSQPLFEDTRSSSIVNRSQEGEEVFVTVSMGGQRAPVTIQVPKPCNMKILKSMLWFHLKKILTLSEYSQILGFQTTPSDYRKDYQLHQGLGDLNQNLHLSCFFKQSRYPSESLLNFKICKLISMGGFSKVYLLRSRTSGDFFTGKFILKETANMELVNNEFQIAQSLDYSFIVKTYSFIQTDHFYVIVMEFVSGGELFELLKDQKTMSEECARFYVAQTLLALRYLHRRSIIYRDIKPQNIILDHEGHIKLTDFGLAKKASERSYSFCGSVDYMAPEVLEDDGYSFEADYYSVGNLLFELLVGSPPFYHPKFTPQQTKYHITNTPIRFSPKMNLTDEVKSLLTELLNKNPDKRLGRAGGVDQILEHPWFSCIDLQSVASRDVIAPFETCIKMELPPEESTENVHEWSFFIERDLKKMQIKVSYQTRKHTIVNRRSVDSHKDISPKSRLSQKFSHQVSPKRNSPSKLTANFSLLHVLTHKRSTSEFPKKNVFHFTVKEQDKKQPGSSSLLKSTNNGRQMSIQRENNSSKKLSHSKQSSQPSFQSNLLINCCKKKNKQNQGFIRKRKKQVKQFCRN